LQFTLLRVYTMEELFALTAVSSSNDSAVEDRAIGKEWCMFRLPELDYDDVVVD
jgi:hypothetical protein